MLEVDVLAIETPLVAVLSVPTQTKLEVDVQAGLIELTTADPVESVTTPVRIRGLETAVLVQVVVVPQSETVAGEVSKESVTVFDEFAPLSHPDPAALGATKLKPVIEVPHVQPTVFDSMLWAVPCPHATNPASPEPGFVLNPPEPV